MKTEHRIFHVTIIFAFSSLLFVIIHSVLQAANLDDSMRQAANLDYHQIRVTNSGSGRNSLYADMSGNGSKITFVSDADFLNQSNVVATQAEVWLYDMRSQGLTRITTGQADRDSSSPSISDDGRWVAFSGDAELLGHSIPIGQDEIWLYDTESAHLTRLTTGTSDRESNFPQISGDGTKIAFLSTVDFLDQGIATYQREIWLYDTTTMTVTRVTDGHSSYATPNINHDGSKLTFHSEGDFLNESLSSGNEIWLYDTASMTVTRVTNGGSGRHSVMPDISDDGSKITFLSNADFLGQGIPPSQFEVWLYDTNTMTVTRVTNGGVGGSSAPAISSDGASILFQSTTNLLDPNSEAGKNGTWRYDTSTMTVTLFMEAFGANAAPVPRFTDDGSLGIFSSNVDFANQTMVEGSEVWLVAHLPQKVYIPIVMR